MAVASKAPDAKGRERVIEMIRKLLTMANREANDGATEGQRQQTMVEAAAAAAKVQELLTTYKLELRDIPEEMSSDRYDQKNFLFNDTTGRWQWRSQLLTTVARYHYCQVLYYAKHLDKNRKNTAILIGKPEDMQVVEFLFEYLSRELTKIGVQARKEHQARGYQFDWYKYERDYLIGAVDAISANLQSRRREDMANADTSSLVVASDAALQQAMDRLFPQLKNRKSKARGWPIDGDAWSKGYARGKQINIVTAVGAGSNGSGKALQA